MRARIVILALCVAVCAACRRAEPAADTRGGLVTDKTLLDGYLVELTHSKWDSGRTADLFDADPETLARTENANPAVLEIRLPTARPLKGISVTTGRMDAGLVVTVRPQGGGAPRTYSKEFREMPPDPTFGLDFDTGPAPIKSLRVEIENLNAGDGHIHIRAVALL